MSAGRSSRRRRLAARVRPKRRHPAAHLLVLECQAQKLAGQRLNFGSAVTPVLKAGFPNKRIELVRTTTVSELGPSLAQILERHGRFRSVLVVGHSNMEGLQLTDDQFFTWEAVGRWLAEFEPEFLFLAACQAGRSEAVRALFAPVPSLREIYASPVALCIDQSSPLVPLIVSVLKSRKIDSAVSRLVRGVNYVITGGQLYRWSRGEVGQGEELIGELWNLAASLLNRRP